MYLGWYDDEIPHLYACSSAEVVDTSVMPAFSDPSEESNPGTPATVRRS